MARGQHRRRPRRRWDGVAEITRSPTIRARTRHPLGVIAARSGSVEQARDILLRAAAEATETTDALTSLAEAVDVCFLLGDATPAVTVAREIERLLPAAADGGPGPWVDRRRVRRILAGEDGHGQIQDGLDRLGSADVGDREPTLAWEVIGRLFLRDSRPLAIS